MHQTLAVWGHHVVALFRAEHLFIESKRGHAIVDDQVRNELVFAVHGVLRSQTITVKSKRISHSSEVGSNRRASEVGDNPWAGLTAIAVLMYHDTLVKTQRDNESGERMPKTPKISEPPSERILVERVQTGVRLEKR